MFNLAAEVHFSFFIFHSSFFISFPFLNVCTYDSRSKSREIQAIRLFFTVYTSIICIRLDEEIGTYTFVVRSNFPHPVQISITNTNNNCVYLSQGSICLQTNICVASQASICLPDKYLHRLSREYLPADKYLRSFSKKYLLPDKYLRRFSREYLPARQIFAQVLKKVFACRQMFAQLLKKVFASRQIFAQLLKKVSVCRQTFVQVLNKLFACKQCIADAEILTSSAYKYVHYMGYIRNA